MACNWNGHTADTGKILSTVGNSVPVGLAKDFGLGMDASITTTNSTFQAIMQTAFCFLLLLGCALGRQGQKCCSSCKSIVGKETLFVGMPDP